MKRLKISSTSIEQSRKLLALGFDPMSADMHYHYKETKIESLRWELLPYGLTTKENYSLRIERLNVGGLWKHKDGTPMTGEEVFEKMYGNDVPSWSSDALANLLPKKIEKFGTLSILRNDNEEWCVEYYSSSSTSFFFLNKASLLDALFCSICSLAEKGIIKPSDIRKGGDDEQNK